MTNRIQKVLKPIFAKVSNVNFYPDGMESEAIEITYTAPKDTEVIAGDVVIVPIELWDQHTKTAKKGTKKAGFLNE